MPTYATPGVIIEEITGPGVIAGVGTSTAGFVGAALSGPIADPRRITSWEDFTRIYGRQGPDGLEVYIGTPARYLAHAVKGFFDNGGRQAWISRAGTAAHAFRDLAPVTGAGSSLRLTALEASSAGNGITVQVADTSLASGLALATPSATIVNAEGDRVVVSSALDFRPGDIVTRTSTSERQVIDRIDYQTNEIFLRGTLLGTYTSGTLRIADLATGQRTFRLQDATGVFAGTVGTLAKGAALSHPVTVASVKDGLVTLEQGLPEVYAISGATIQLTSNESTITMRRAGSPDEVFTGVSMSRRHPRYYERAMTSQWVRAQPAPTPASAAPPGNRPAVAAATALAGGRDDELEAIGAGQYEAAIGAFDTIDDVNLICAPDVHDADSQTLVVDHCVRMADRFGILHVAPAQDIEGALAHRAEVESERGFAALYYPWILVRDPLDPAGALMPVPPVGHVAGVFARVDQSRGVHKAPANELVRGALALERAISDAQQDPLNTAGVNVIRTFPGQARPTVWGARTTVAADVTDWLYVNVRRLLLYIEESLQEGLRWAVFEPNGEPLWKGLERTINAFLAGVWRDGALFGATTAQAFSVRIDEALNPPESRALGRLFIEIKVAPVRPAEFIIVRIGLWDGGDEASEQ
jgi:phage tail sheath protein FI